MLLAALAALILLLVTESFSPYNNLQLANGTYYFAALAGLTVLAGTSGQISLGHGALMAVGAYTVALLVGKEDWSVAPALAAATAATAVIGVPVGAAASRLRGPYLAGATLAFAVGLPALADKFPDHARRRERPGDQPADAAGLARLQLPARALGGVDRLPVRADRVLRALQPQPQRRRARLARRARRRDSGLAVRAAHGPAPDACVHRKRSLRRTRRGRARARPPARRARLLPAPALALSPRRRGHRRPRLADGRDLGRRAARPAPELVQRPRSRVLVLDQGVGQPAARGSTAPC